jgi:hypothetical protein
MDERLWYTADKERVVQEGDVDAASLFCVPGDEVPKAEAQRLGLLEKDPVEQLEEEITLEELENMTVEELKDLARENDLAVGGSKADLIKRLSEPEENKMRNAGEDKGG